MKEFMVLLGQIFLISCLQSITEIFVDPDKKPYQARVLNIACFAGSLYLLIQFVFGHLMKELVQVIHFPF